MKEAVGTSLLVIAMKSAAGFVGYLGQVQISWIYLGLFTAVAIAGSLGGTYLVRYVSQEALKKTLRGLPDRNGRSFFTRTGEQSPSCRSRQITAPRQT